MAVPTTQKLDIDILRETEVYRLLPQLLDEPEPPTTPRPPRAPSAIPHHVELPSDTHDAVLTGLAQLAALRLNTRRCLISLFDRRQQLVVAESTRDSNLLLDARARGQTWLGGTAIPRSFGVCGHMIEGPYSGPRLPSADTADSSVPVSFSVIPDLALDPLYKDRPFVVGYPFNRFYAGVSLVSRSGLTIGVLCVLDDAPRTSLDQPQLDFLHELSRTVTTHLESSRLAASRRRGERMVRGLVSFFEGRASLAQRTHDDDDDSRHHATAAHRPQPVPLQSVCARDQVDHGSGPTERGSRQLSASMDSSDAASAIKTIRTMSPEPDPIMRKARAILARAAKIIRDSVEVDSVAFLDAHFSSFGGLVRGQMVTGATAERQVLAGEHLGTTTIGGDPTPCLVLGAAWSDATDHGGNGTGSHIHISERVLQSLLNMYPSGKIFTFDEAGHPLLGTDDEVLRSGCSSARASDDGSCSQQVFTPMASDASPFVSNTNAVVSHQTCYELIASAFPGARSVALVPLWDAPKEQWFAGCFMWTNSPSRSFMLDGEMSYLRAFATTIMADVDHLGAFASERAKNSLLGSISHELRSPLHGIVAALELLEDTQLTASQLSMLRTMDHCGRTLLDVINHLLDFSKISTLAKWGGRGATTAGQFEMSTRHDEGALHPTEYLRRSPAVELDALVEETVDSIFSGLAFGQSPSSSKMSENAARSTSSQATGRHCPTRSDSVCSAPSLMSWASDSPQDDASTASMSVHLEIAAHVSWLAHVDAGALRRIVMNLVGNAFKYTDAGFVRVKMDQTAAEMGVQNSTQNLRLTVTDSGRGIDPEFLRNRAFRPFSQEDVLSQGTGVGLSLAKEIVQALGGSLSIESQLHFGTSVTVELPLQLPDGVKRPPSPFWTQVAALKGLRVLLHGFRAEAGALGIPGRTPPAELDVMTTICREWLQLDIIPASATDIKPDVIICTSRSAERLVAANDGVLPPVVAICDSVVTAHAFVRASTEDYGGRVFETMSQPVGPRKLADVIIFALGRFNDAKVSDLVASIAPGLGSGSTLDSLATPHFVADRTANSPLSALTGSRPSVQRMASIDSSLDGASLAVIPDGTFSPNSCPGGSRADALSTQEFPGPNIVAAARDQFLLVDDNVINRKILVAFMNKLGRSYQTACDGQEALDVYTAHPGVFSHILMDISMPVMDGLEATRRVRQVEVATQLRRSKIIALTGLNSAEVQNEAFASGVDVFLTKPVRFKDLSPFLAD